MPHLRCWINKKIFSTMIVVLITLSTLLPLTKESLPASLAGNTANLSTTIKISTTDYTADTPTSGPNLSAGTAITYFVDFANDTGSTDSLTTFTLATTNHTTWGGTAVCDFITGISGQDHNLLDFDTLASPCGFDGSYGISGTGFPTSLTVGNAIYIRVTGLTLGNSTIGFTTRANGMFGNGDLVSNQRNAAYARVGTLVITGQIFNDPNADAIQAPAELGIAGIGVNLIQEISNNNNDPILSTSVVTDENGYYGFNEIDTIGFTPGSSYRVSALVTTYRLTTGNNIQQFFNILAGSYAAAAIGLRNPISSQVGDRVWDDLDGDGMQDNGTEIGGISGVSLALHNANTTALVDGDTSNGTGNYVVGAEPSPPSQCFGRNLNQAGSGISNVETSYECQVQAGGQYFLTLRTDNFCFVDNSAFRLLDASDNVLAEGSCNRSGYPNNMVAETVYNFGPFSETQAGTAHLIVVESYHDFTFLDVNWNYSGPIGYDAYLEVTDIPPGYTVSPADVGSDTQDNDITTEVSPGVYRSNNFFFQFDHLNPDIDIGIHGAIVETPDISITKIANAPTTGSGDVISYIITVTNNGVSTSATGVTVYDILPNEVTFVSESASVGTYNPLNGEWEIGTMLPGSSAKLSIAVSIANASVPTITNTANVTASTPESNYTNNESSASISPTPPPTPSPSPSPSASPSPSPSASPSASPSPSPSASPSPSPSATSTPAPSPTPTASASSGGGGASVNPPGITIVGGSNNSSSNSGWHYSNNTSSNRNNTTNKQAQVRADVPAVPPAPSEDPLTCLQIAGTTSRNFLDISLATDQIQAKFLTSILNIASGSRIVQGYNDQTYGIDQKLTRFELTKIALQANCLQPNQLTPNTAFTDVPHDSSEMSLIIGTAYNLGIVTGKDGKFYPNQAVTYAEMSKILLGSGYYFHQQTPDIIYSSSFSGITDESFRQYAEYAVRLQLVYLQNGSFPQNAPIYRNTMLQVLSRYISYLKSISIS